MAGDMCKSLAKKFALRKKTTVTGSAKVDIVPQKKESFFILLTLGILS